jgi:16S rRNA (adenine1518-N6/adenine1519-N6)-dimethyltransferase
MDKKRCIEIIKNYIILPTHSLGQNFLVDERAAQEIAEVSSIGKDDTVLEIGPGLGALTEKLCDRAAFVYAVEIDVHLIEALQATLASQNNVEVITADFLKLPRNSFQKGKGDCRIVSNLPYYAMTPILLKLFREWEDARSMVFTVENAACDRIFAEPETKSYGPISVFSSLYGKKEKLFILEPKSFHPAPHTKSAVIRLKSNGLLESAPSVLFPLVNASFSQRRKTLLNALSSSGLFPDGKVQVEEVLQNAGISSKRRAESLVPEDFMRMANEMIPK